MGNISRRDLLTHLAPAISATAIPPIASTAATNLVERARVGPSEFLKMSPTLTLYYERYGLPVCTENFVWIDLVRESHNVSGDGRAVMLFAHAVHRAVQVEEST